MKEFLFASSMKSEITSAPFFVELGYLQTLEKFGSILFPLIGHYTSSSHSSFVFFGFLSLLFLLIFVLFILRCR